MTGDRDGYFEVKRTIKAHTGVGSLGDIDQLHDERVRALAGLVQTEVHRWLECHPLSSENRLSAMALTCSAMCVDLGFEAALVSTKLTLLMFAIDDVVDGTFFVPLDEQADALLIACGELALAGGGIDFDARRRGLSTPLATELDGYWLASVTAFDAFCKDLRRMPGADAYYEYFAGKFMAMTEGMRVELRARRRFIEDASIPGFDEYFHNGQRSVGAPAVFASTLVASNPVMTPDDWAAVLGFVDECLWGAGACIRLTNDVRSHARELEIEQRPNSVAIKMLGEGLNEAEAEAAMIRLADESLAMLEHRVPQVPAALRVWAESVWRFTSVIRDWYMLRELHDQGPSEAEV